MSAILGISCDYHDAAAALVVDGVIVAAMQEERFSRRKNDPSLPLQAARAGLARGGLLPGDLDRVVFYEDTFAKLERVLASQARSFPRSLRQFPRAVSAQLGHKLWVLDRLAEALGVPRKKVGHVEHHRAHAASAFFTSPYPEAAVLTVDGVGEEASTVLWHGKDRELRALGSVAFPHSLGLLYAGLTAYLGFAVNEGEYKVMGLAAHGKPTRDEDFARLLMPGEQGAFSLGLPYFASMADAELGFGPALERLLGPRRPPGRPGDLAGSAEDRGYADIAASLQACTERALLALSTELRRRLPEVGALALAGGVALNCVAVARLARDSGFARLYVPPAAGDAGAALGAAILGALEAGDPRPAPLVTAALGEAISAADASDLAGALGLEVRRLSDPAAEVARRLGEGQLLGFCQGRFELGPRALGQRSLLAAPQEVATRERINRVIKQREPFRPLAPAVLASQAARYFAGTPSDLTPFMTTVCPVRADAPAPLGAVRHVDGSARVQTVTAASAPGLAAVLLAFERIGQPPVVVNTSLNGPGEPICGDATDALTFFLGHGLDALVIEDCLITAPPK
jgi:carbamoyltransferase